MCAWYNECIIIYMPGKVVILSYKNVSELGGSFGLVFLLVVYPKSIIINHLWSCCDSDSDSDTIHIYSYTF